MKKLLFAFFTVIHCVNAVAQSENNPVLDRFSEKQISNQSSKELKLFSPSRQPSKGEGVIKLELNREVLTFIWEMEPNKFKLNLPLPDGESEELEFVKTSIATEDFAIKTSDGRKLFGKEYLGIHYQLVQNEKSRLGGLSFREDGLMGMISHSGGNYNLGETNPGRGDYVISDDRKIAFPGWNCETEDGKELLPSGKETQTTNKAASTLCKPVRIYMEADFDTYTRSANNMTTTTNFVTGLFNLVKQVYQNEQITLQLSQIFVWTSVDPYATLTNTGQILSSFSNNRPAASVNGDLAHFLDCRSNSLGGIAYIGALCNSGTKHGFSSIYYSYSSLPTFSWSVFIVSHELGHNFGSRHTHWCGWTLPNGTTGRIDSCSAGEGSCGSITKATKGTIMSYCYNTFLGVDMNLGFGPLPGKAIRDWLSSVTCITGNSCIASPVVSVDSMTNLDKNYKLTLSIPANHNATAWTLLEGSTVIQSGSLANQNAVSIPVNISNKPNGTFIYSARLSSGNVTSTSSSLSVTVAVPVNNPGSGNCTASGLQSWFGTDGKLRFKFNLSPTCTTYNVQMCRYSLNNPIVPPVGMATPVACGVRNSMNAYTPTTAERTQGFIERIASPQPSSAITPGMGSFWYSMDVLCTGSGCTTTNRTRTYIFVPGI